MALIVQKFGGSSVADARRIMAAAQRAVDAKRAGNQVVMVISARGDKTDELIELAKQIGDHPPPRWLPCCKPMSAKSTPTWTASTRPTLGW